MKILDRYLAKTLLFYTLGVMAVWIGIYALFNFIDEIKFIGQGSYTALSAMIYVLSDIPAVMYSHSSVIILLGCLLALGHLASTSQLVIARGSGMSIMQLAKIVVKIALIFITVVIFLGEIISPITTQYAESYRSNSLGRNASTTSQEGFWIKDGSSIIHVEKNFNGKLFEGLSLIESGKENQVELILQSDKAMFDKNNLKLKEASGYSLSKNNNTISIAPVKHNLYNAKVLFDQDLINDLKKDPYELSSWDLYKQIHFLNSNNLSASAFKVELYKRIIKPVTLIAMLLFSMLFIFGSLRDASLGKKIFLGVVISLFFELSSRIGSVISLKFDYSPLLSTSAPTIAVLIVALILLRRKSER